MIDREGIQELLDRMARAYVQSDAKACADMFTDTAQLHSPFGPPARGRAEIEALHLEWTAEPSDKRFNILDYGSSADLAWCLCRFSEGDLAGNGTSLIVLDRQSSGNWLIRSCCLHGAPEDD